MKRTQVLASSAKQGGVSLVSLMLGLLLGLMSVLAAVSLFRLQAQQSVTTQRVSTTLEAQTIGLQVAELSVQQAGFGLEDSDSQPSGQANSDFMLLSGASLPSSASSAISLAGASLQLITDATAVSGNAVLWRWRDPNSGNFLCAGMIGSNNGFYLLGDTACSANSNLQSQSWPAASKRAIVSPSDMPLGFVFSAQRGSCSPYSQSAAAAALLLELRIQPDTSNAVSPWYASDKAGQDALLNNLSARSNLCLPGIRL